MQKLFSSYRFSVAPMLDWTDRHCRNFFRLLTRHSLLYTEMITTGAILRGDQQRHLSFEETELPLAAQLGGCNPTDLALCAQIIENYGYSEVNLNVGCPSDRVQSGRFGAILMAEPEIIAESVAEMKAKVNIPVTVKCRLGIDKQDSYEFLYHFVQQVSRAGCDRLIVHARKAWLKGLSPKENRTIPPLDHARVYQIKQAFPHLPIVINGGIESIDQAIGHLSRVDGVMLGRAVYHNPYLLSQVDSMIFEVQNDAILSRESILMEYGSYLSKQVQNNVPLRRMTRHLHGLFQGQSNAKKWRRYLSELEHEKISVSEFIYQGLSDSR